MKLATRKIKSGFTSRFRRRLEFL